jgi:hypothetical protein
MTKAKLVNENVKVTAGKLIKVYNQKRRVLTQAKNWYYALWIEDHDGGNERCIMLTGKELENVEHRASKNQEDCIVRGSDSALRLESVLWDRKGRTVRVYNKNRKHWKANTYYVAVIVENENGDNERCLLFTEYELNRAEDRAKKNAEDIPSKGFLADLFD